MAKSGQGPQRHTSAPKREPRANAYRPQGVSQYGQMQGSHITHDSESDYRGEPKRGGAGYNNPVGPINMALSGPGAGRKIYDCGSQSTHGNVAQGNPPPNRQRDALENE